MDRKGGEGREGKERKGVKGQKKRRKGRENGDRPPNSFGLKVALLTLQKCHVRSEPSTAAQLQSRDFRSRFAELLPLLMLLQWSTDVCQWWSATASKFTATLY